MRHSAEECPSARDGRREPRFFPSLSAGCKPRLLATLSLALLAPAFGGSVTPAASSFILLGIGALALAFPAAPGASRTESLLALLLLLAAACGWLLPAALFHLPWRDRLLQAGFSLPASVSPQPWASFRAWLSLLAGLVWFAWLRGQPWSARERRWLAESLAAGLAALALFSLLALHFNFVPPAWNTNVRFGPFPNRNQTATLFALGAFLALVCGLDRLRRSRSAPSSFGNAGRLAAAAVFWSGLLVIDLLALAADFSRSGPLLFTGLALAWLLLGPAWKNRPLVLAAAAAALLLFATLFLVAGGPLLARFGSESLRDFRLKIFADALLLIRSSPWTGVGLGSFPEIFPLYRHASVIQQRIIHPESDWLWLAAETGLSGLAAALLLMGHALLRPGLRFADSPDRPLRSCLALASAAFLLHSAVDVPAHRFGTILPALLLFALSTARARDQAPATPAATAPFPPALSPWFLRLPALALFCSGLVCTIALCTRSPLPFADGPSLLTRQAGDDLAARRDPAALAALDRALAWAPLDWRAHFTRAIAAQRLGHYTAALRDFRQARFLEPSFAGLPWDEALAWLDYSPRFALDPFLEALRRTPAEARPALFQRILSAEYPHAPLRDPLWNAATSSPALVLTYLGAATSADATARLADLLLRDPGFRTIPSPARPRLFSLWLEKGNPTLLTHFISLHPDSLQDAWRPLADYQAARGDFPAAAALYTRWLPPPAIPPAPSGLTLADAQRRFEINPADFPAALLLCRHELSQAHAPQALAILQRIPPGSGLPPSIRYLEATLLAQSGRSEAAWKIFSSF